jgi:hypothetical protein
MVKGPSNYLKVGDHLAWCMRCGFRYHASELIKEWTGFLVCSPCLDPRHPQDLIRGIRETPPPKDQSPRNDGPSTLIPGSWNVIAAIEYLMNDDGEFILNEYGEKIVIGQTPPVVSSMPDNAGSPYFIPFGPADRSKL